MELKLQLNALDPLLFGTPGRDAWGIDKIYLRKLSAKPDVQKEVGRMDDRDIPKQPPESTKSPEF